MAKENNGRRRVFRQSWKPNGILKLLMSIWTAIYSVFKIVVGALATVAVIAGVCLLVFVGTLGDYLESDILPNSEVTLEGFDLSQNSVTYYLDANGELQVLQKLYATTISDRATYEEIPEAMINAAVAIEDKRFYEHQGVDWFTTIKACVNMFIGSGDQFGGSSITQQLIKNLFDADDITVQRKVQEIFRATELEKRYDKKIIVTWYLNEIYLGNRINGVKAAASYYFGKELELLTPAECACLISITNNPSIYDPTSETLMRYEVKEGDIRLLNGFERNHIRKENTLWVMRNEGYLTEEEYQAALAYPIVLKRGIDPDDKLATCPNENCGYRDTVGTYDKREDGVYYCPQCGGATTIGEDASQNVYSWMVDTVLEDVATAFAARDGLVWSELDKSQKNFYKEVVCGGGYHIYTTLDMTVQEAVDTIYKDLSQIPTAKSVQQLQSGIVVIDNRTGDIVAMSGGVGDEKGHDDFNRATDAKLQPGSSMKPLAVYAPAFELGLITPASVILDMPYEILEDDRPYPYNDDRRYSYSSTVLNGIEQSINCVSVNTLDAMGVSYSYNFAKNLFGLSTLTNNYVNSAGTIFSDEALAPLGMGAPTLGITLRDITAAYATFANKGVYREARTFTRIYNSKGELVLDNSQDERAILSDKTVDYVNYCLDNAVANGTGWNADLKYVGANGTHIDVCGKTGTTASMKDRWFCGYTNYYTAAVWCGYDLPEVIKLTGIDQSNPAGRLWKKVMEPLHKGLNSVPMYDADKFAAVDICLDCGKLATANCNKDPRYVDNKLSRVDYNVLVYQEDIPLEKCDCHVEVDWCDDCNAAANEYCKKLASVGRGSISERCLVKMTKAEFDEIVLVSDKGLYSQHCQDNYIYLVDKDGNDLPFPGIQGDANAGVDAPYLVCDEHTKKMWDEYLEDNPLQDSADSDDSEEGGEDQ